MLFQTKGLCLNHKAKARSSKMSSLEIQFSCYVHSDTKRSCIDNCLLAHFLLYLYENSHTRSLGHGPKNSKV